MATRPFIDTLRELRNGATQDELAECLNELVAAVERQGKAGTLTLTITVTPVSKEMSGQVIVSDDVKVKLPKQKRARHYFSRRRRTTCPAKTRGRWNSRSSRWSPRRRRCG